VPVSGKILPAQMLTQEGQITTLALPTGRGIRPILLLVIPWVLLALAVNPETAAGQSGEAFVSGVLVDAQGDPVVEADVSLWQGEDVLAEAKTQEDGSFRLVPDLDPVGLSARVEMKRSHFHSQYMEIDSLAIESAQAGRIIDLGTITLERKVTPGFYAAALLFVIVLALIAFERLHSTTAALAGMSALFLVHYIGGQFDEGFRIFGFERGLGYINWEVIFLVLGMMIVIAIIEGTGIFQWTAFQAYRLSRGRAWLLVVILMLVTALASALLDNFTTMLLMTPISLQIALAIGIDPLALIIPEVLASNVGGISTLIGTPTNILIGAHADIGFSDFLVNQTAGVVVALVVMGAFVLYHYRSEWSRASGGISNRLLERLESSAGIRDREALMKSGVVFVLILVGFVLGEKIHLVPAVSAMVGATILLIWLNPDVQEMIKAVDWTTLVFFFAIFVVIGGVQEVGLISALAGAMARLIGDSVALAIFVIVFGAGTLSVAIANIPLAASMLPIVDFLTGSVPGASGKVLYYALSMGAAMGGNGFLIGGEANLVTAGISRQAGTPISFGSFLRVGLPVTYLTLAVGFGWLVLRFVVLGS
jgi:Na+/H+ antiporter NhaD/arsenite permease-like protein